MAIERVVALAGGVGGAKLAHGLQLALPDPTRLSVIVNTADDFDLYGLRICPDLDTVMYTLTGWANPVTGWGVRDDSLTALDMLACFGEEPWFQLGDRDFATHILRTQRLRAGQPLSTITRELARALGSPATLIPMSDDPVATLLDTPAGRHDFQQYFVRATMPTRSCGVTFHGIEQARPTDAALVALSEADAIVFCPSNPFVSVGPILAVPGLRAALAAAPAPKVAVSPIVGGRALRDRPTRCWPRWATTSPRTASRASWATPSMASSSTRPTPTWPPASRPTAHACAWRRPSCRATPTASNWRG